MAVIVKSGVRLTGGQRAYVEVLQAALPFPIVVTSGDRTPDQQADAMLAKWRAKGSQELRTVYRQSAAVIDALLAAPKTTAAWAAVIRAKGSRLSRHLWSGAVDLRTRDLSAGQLADLQRAVVKTGGRAYAEYDHLHVDLPLAYAARAVGDQAAQAGARGAKRIAAGWVFAWVAGGLVVAGLIWRARAQRGRIASAGASTTAQVIGKNQA